MSNRPRRLRDFFDGLPDRKRLSSLRETGELIDEIAETHELDVESFASEAHQSHRRLWHKVEDETEHSKPRLRDRLTDRDG